MERAEWLNQMRRQAEAVYDQLSPLYWVSSIGFYENESQLRFLQRFLERVSQRTAGQPGWILSAACGAGRYDGILLEAGHSVLGTDQSAGMLARAREHFPLEQFPRLRYEKVGLQEMDFHEAFEGAICMDALEHVCPEDWPGIMRNFAAALKPGGLLYFNADSRDPAELEAAYRRGLAKGLPLVYGEVADGVKADYTPEEISAEAIADADVYHYIPPVSQVRVWLAQAGLSVEAEGTGSGYHHILARKASA